MARIQEWGIEIVRDESLRWKDYSGVEFGVGVARAM